MNSFYARIHLMTTLFAAPDASNLSDVIKGLLTVIFENIFETRWDAAMKI